MKIVIQFAFDKELANSPDWEKEVVLHREYLKKHLLKYNIASGVFLDQTGGLMIVEMDHKDAVEDIINNNPLVKAGKVKASVHEWLILEGNL